jgi:hypothetical protein
VPFGGYREVLISHINRDHHCDIFSVESDYCHGIAVCSSSNNVPKTFTKLRRGDPVEDRGLSLQALCRDFMHDRYCTSFKSLYRFIT